MTKKYLLDNMPMFWVVTLISTAGMIVCSQSVTFGWDRKDFQEFSSHTQSICLFVAGLALMFVGVLARKVLAKLAALEQEIAQLRSAKLNERA